MVHVLYNVRQEIIVNKLSCSIILHNISFRQYKPCLSKMIWKFSGEIVYILYKIVTLKVTKGSIMYKMYIIVKQILL